MINPQKENQKRNNLYLWVMGSMLGFLIIGTGLLMLAMACYYKQDPQKLNWNFLLVLEIIACILLWTSIFAIFYAADSYAFRYIQLVMFLQKKGLADWVDEARKGNKLDFK